MFFDTLTFLLTGGHIRNYTPLAERELVGFEIRLPDRPVIWKGFSSHLYYAVEQVINNAIDFSPENGTIRLEAYKTQNSIVLGVTDQGPGISIGNEEEIFKRYISYREKDMDRHTGTGLFLSMNVLRRIGGNISAKNAAPHGAAFTITLPVK